MLSQEYLVLNFFRRSGILPRGIAGDAAPCMLVRCKMIEITCYGRSGMVLDGPFFESVIPCLEFSIEFQSNKLIYQKEYTKRQQIIYVLIKHLHDSEGWGYRKISKWLNQSGIKTHRGKNWFSSSVISVLKRKHERDLRVQQIWTTYSPQIP